MPSGYANGENGEAATVPWKGEGNDQVVKTLTLSGLSVGSSTGWTAGVMRDQGSTAVIFNPTVTTSTAANTVTMTCSTAQIAALTSSADSFAGRYALRKKSAKRTYVKGPFTIIDSGLP